MMPINTQGDILMDSCDVEQEILDKGLTAPRITKAHVDDLLARVEFKSHRIPDTTTVVSIGFLDGFSLGVGTSACVDPANFDLELGTKIATRNATAQSIDKLWELEGYVLHKVHMRLNKSE